MEIYAPLAGRMGMQWLREELEDHAFRWLNPEGHAAVVDRLKMLRERNQGLIEEIETALRKKLEEAKVSAIVACREKKPYAIWSKMERKQISLEQLSDIYAFRIVVDEVERLLPGARRGAHHLARGARPLQGLHFEPRSRTTTSRSTPPSSARVTSAPSCRSAPSGCIRSPNMAWRRMRSTRTSPTARSAKRRAAEPREQRLSLAAPSRRHAARRRQSRGVPRAHQARAVSGSGVLLHPEGQADRAAARRQRRSTSPMRCTPTSATPASAARSTDGRCRSSPSSGTATRSRSSPRRRRRRRPPGKASPSPARRARRSGGRRAMRRAPNTASSAAKSSSAPSAGAASASARRRSLRRSGRLSQKDRRKM